MKAQTTLFTDTAIEELPRADLISGVFEAGQKIWECTFVTHASVSRR